MTHPWFTASTAPRVLAHRGYVSIPSATDGIVENSFAAVAAAHAIGATYVESDCHLTADGEVVLFHDADLLRVTGDPRTIASVRRGELEDIMSERGGLLTLRQALESFPTVRFNLDVKADAAADPTGRLVAPHADRVLLTSFSDARRRRALAAAHHEGGQPATSGGRATIARAVAAAALHAPGVARNIWTDVDALQIPEQQGRLRVLTPALIQTAHRHGVEVHVWTVDDPADVTRLLAMGVDGIITDRADLALPLVAAHGR